MLNAMQADISQQDIAISTLESFISSNNLLAPITAYASSGTNQSALIACNYIAAMLSAADPVIHTSVPANFAAIQLLGPGLIADPATGVTSQLLTQMMALIAPPTSWWSAKWILRALGGHRSHRRRQLLLSDQRFKPPNQPFPETRP